MTLTTRQQILYYHYVKHYDVRRIAKEAGTSLRYVKDVITLTWESGPAAAACEAQKIAIAKEITWVK